MINKFLFICLLLLATFIFSTNSALAYGGGGGVPPGFPPPPKFKLVCVQFPITIKIPFNRIKIVYVPKCHIEIVKVNSKNNFNERFNNFVDKVNSNN